MKNIRDHLISAVVAVLLGSPVCTLAIAGAEVSGVNNAVPHTAPSITGQVTAIALPVIRVEENPAESHGSAKAFVRITNDTQLLRSEEGDLSVSDLQVGQLVKIWFKGPIMESYPLQATAGVIYIEPKNKRSGNALNFRNEIHHQDLQTALKAG